MTVEEAVIGILALAALVLLFIGLAEALDDRGERRRPRDGDDEEDGGPRGPAAPSS